MSEQSEREAYNEAAREYHEGKEREEMDRPMFTQRDVDAAVQAEREAIIAAIQEDNIHIMQSLQIIGEKWIAMIRSRGPAPAVDVSPRGVWRCECCGEMFDGISPEWRMSAGQMAHKCPGNDPQAGYFTARFFPDTSPAPAVDVITDALRKHDRLWCEALVSTGDLRVIEKVTKYVVERRPESVAALVSPATGEGKENER